MFDRTRNRLDDPDWMRTFHGWATAVWFVASVPLALLFGTSIFFVAWLSLYAIVVAHFSSWQAARAEIEAASGDGA